MFSIQIVSLLMTFLVSLVYFSRKRKPTFQHRLFIYMIIMTYANIVFEMAVILCAKKLDTSHGMITLIVNFIYNLLSFIFFYEMYVYIRFLSTGEETTRRKTIFEIIIPVGILYAFVIVHGLKLNNPMDSADKFVPGSPFLGLAIILYHLLVLRFVISGWKANTKTNRMAIIMNMICLTGIGITQRMNFDIRVSTLGMVVLCFSFCMTVESPDAILIEKLAYEKERADAANEAKSSFLANMSHEIRTPMNAIVGMTDIMLRSDLTPQQRNYMLNIKQSGKSLLMIINDLLDFSKIEAGKMELVEVAYDPHSFINDIGMLVLNRIGDKPIELIFDIDANLPSKLFGDPGRIKQIIINLMNNAVKFTDEGYVKLSIKKVSQNGRMSTIEIFVEDSGQGIKEEDQEKLFDAFSQVDMKRNRGKEGSGLGLSITRQLTELMGGSIGVKSEYEKGSTFTVTINQKVIVDEPIAVIKNKTGEIRLGGCLNSYDTMNVGKISRAFSLAYKELSVEELLTSDCSYLLIDEEIYKENEGMIVGLVSEERRVAVVQNPMKNSFVVNDIQVINKPLFSANLARFINDDEQIIWAEEEDSLVSFVAPKANVLLVDDNDMNLKVGIGLLSPINMNIDVARSGREALIKAAKKKYHIIFMDHMMPGMDGAEATALIRELPDFDSYYRTAPIVALTANVSDEAKKQFEAVGVKDFISKPINIMNTISTIKRLLPDELIEHSTTEASVGNVGLEKVDVESAYSKTQAESIEGIDVDEGIKYSGSKELFESLLGDFYNIIDMKSRKIRKCLEDGLLRDFTIEVHALKSTSRMIGAMELSKQFAELEKLGNEENESLLKEKTPRVLEVFMGFKDRLKTYARVNDGDKRETSNEDLVALLRELKDSIENFDVDRADRAMSELEECRFPDEAAQLMEELRVFVSDVSMEEIISTADKLVDVVKSQDM